MIANRETGEIVLESGTVLSPRTTRSDFLRSPEGAASSMLVRNEPWCSFKFAVPAESLVLAVFFNGESIQAMHLAIVDADSAPWSHEAELRRKEANDRWLLSKGLTPGKTYAWGSVWSGYDPKGGSSSAVLSFSGGS
jgi:hypothetical protein